MSTGDNDPVQQQDGTQSQSWELQICEAAGISFAEADGQWRWCSPSGESSAVEFTSQQAAAKDAIAECFPNADWQYEVANGDTRNSYSGWVESKAETYVEDYAAFPNTLGGVTRHLPAPSLRSVPQTVNVETYIDAAQQHGIDEDPDHEVGDLQEFFRVAFGLLKPEQVAAFAADPRVTETLAIALCLDED